MKKLASKTSIVAASALSIVLLSAFSTSNDKVTICHKNHHTITVSTNALQAHIDHGDSQGVCIERVGDFSPEWGFKTGKEEESFLDQLIKKLIK